MKLDVNCDCHQSIRNRAPHIRDGAFYAVFLEGDSSYGASRPAQASVVPVEGKPLPAPGSLEANETVAKMMASMGYKPGMVLGKNGQGILRPVNTTFRPANIGLGRIKEPKPFFA